MNLVGDHATLMNFRAFLADYIIISFGSSGLLGFN